MHRPLPHYEACTVVMHLSPADSPPTIAEVAAVADSITSWRGVSESLTLLDATPADMRACRAMFCAELQRQEGPREMVLDRILMRHENLSSQIRVNKVLDELPTLAVYRDKRKPPVKAPDKKTGFQLLQSAMNHGLRHKAA